MRPTLWTIDTGVEAASGLGVPAYFTMVAIGFGLAIFLAWRWAGRSGLKRDSVLDLGLYMIIFGIIGARLLHVVSAGQLSNYINWCLAPEAVVWEITEIECLAPGFDGRWDALEQVCRPTAPGSRPVWERCTLWLQFWQGGLAYYGGFLLAALYGVYFIRREKLPLGRVLDMTGWAIPFGLGWGRMGCFLNGCCYGAVAEGIGDPPWWAVAFPRWSPAWLDQLRSELIQRTAEASLHVHPTQLYSSISAFTIAAIAYAYLEPRKRFNGEVFLSSCVLYASARFVIELLRRDARGEAFGLTTSQLIGLAVVAVVLWAWPRMRRASRRELPGASGPR